MGTPLPMPSPLPCSQWETWAALSGPSRILPSLLGTSELAGLDSLGAECACLGLVIGWALLWGAALSSLTMRWSCFQHLPWGGGAPPAISSRQARPIKGFWFLVARWWQLLAVE